MQKKGLESLYKRVAKGALVPLKTDKSQKLTVIGMEDYIEPS